MEKLHRYYLKGASWQSLLVPRALTLHDHTLRMSAKQGVKGLAFLFRDANTSREL